MQERLDLPPLALCSSRRHLASQRVELAWQCRPLDLSGPSDSATEVILCSAGHELWRSGMALAQPGERWEHRVDLGTQAQPQRTARALPLLSLRFLLVWLSLLLLGSLADRQLHLLYIRHRQKRRWRRSRL